MKTIFLPYDDEDEGKDEWGIEEDEWGIEEE